MEPANPDRVGGEMGEAGPEATVTQAWENASSAEAGSASENTAVMANKKITEGRRQQEGTSVPSTELGEMVRVQGQRKLASLRPPEARNCSWFYGSAPGYP